CVLAVIAPWAAYPSVFVLGPASMGLLVPTLRRRGRSLGILWMAMTGLFVLSRLILWQTGARYQTTAAPGEFWGASVLDLSSPGAAAAWVGRCLVEIGNYGTREMGLPLLVLALVGAASLRRRRPWRVVLLAGPLVFALITSALGRYP